MDADIKTGVHVFHASTLSNCSQRVLFVAIEKGIPFKSHPIDLKRAEQLSPRFLAINPRGLVPALVHDALIVTESNNIIAYLDDMFPEPRLQADQPELRKTMSAWLDQSDSVQSDIKLLTFEFLLNPMAKMSKEQLSRYAEAQCDEALVAFHRTFSTTGFSRAAIAGAASRVLGHIERLEEALTSNEYLCGTRLSLADVSWVVNAHRFELLGFELRRRPAVEAWLRSIKARPAYAQSVLQLEPFAMRVLFAVQRFKRWIGRSDVMSFLPAGRSA